MSTFSDNVTMCESVTSTLHSNNALDKVLSVTGTSQVVAFFFIIHMLEYELNCNQIGINF
jgi:hypothetical protein